MQHAAPHPYIHTYIHAYTHTYMQHAAPHPYIQTYIHAYTHTYMQHAAPYPYIHTYIHAYTHTRIHTCSTLLRISNAQVYSHTLGFFTTCVSEVVKTPLQLSSQTATLVHAEDCFTCCFTYCFARFTYCFTYCFACILLRWYAEDCFTCCFTCCFTHCFAPAAGHVEFLLGAIRASFYSVYSVYFLLLVQILAQGAPHRACGAPVGRPTR
jgi:hypothetical protein